MKKPPVNVRLEISSINDAGEASKNCRMLQVMLVTSIPMSESLIFSLPDWRLISIVHKITLGIQLNL